MSVIVLFRGLIDISLRCCKSWFLQRYDWRVIKLLGTILSAAVLGSTGWSST